MSTINVSPDGAWYVVTFFPDAIENSVLDEPEKGWRAVMGDLNGEQVPMRAYYMRSMYTLDQVKDFAERLNDCEACKRANEHNSVTEINVPNNYQLQQQRAPVGRSTPAASMSGVGKTLGDMLVQSLLKTTMTPLGQVLTATLLNDDEMMESVKPKTNDDVLNLAADFLSSKNARTALFRDPKEMMKYAAAIRSGTTVSAKPSPEEDEMMKHVKRARTVILS